MSAKRYKVCPVCGAWFKVVDEFGGEKSNEVCPNDKSPMYLMFMTDKERQLDPYYLRPSKEINSRG